MTELEPVADDMIKNACDAFAETYVTYPDGCASTPITDWFDLDAQDAVDFGVLKSPKWSYHSDIRSDEYRDYVAAVIRNPMRAALSSAQSAIAERDARIAELEATLAEADALIEAQQHDFAQNNIRNAENAHRAEAAEALLKEAGKALEPFAKAADDLHERYPDEYRPDSTSSVNMGHLRAARAIHHKIGVKDE